MLHRGNAAPQDVTEAVQIVYDALYHSMDAGSGFLDSDEMDALRELAAHGGFEVPHFPGDRCKCGHTWNYHHALTGTPMDGCSATKVVTEPTYRREQRQMLQPAPVPKEEIDRIQRAIANAETADEVQMILAGAATKVDLVAVTHEVTVRVNEGERAPCDCSGWEYAP
jgi:hypothetical protein